jgi:hypothetical protein
MNVSNYDESLVLISHKNNRSDVAKMCAIIGLSHGRLGVLEGALFVRCQRITFQPSAALPWCE